VKEESAFFSEEKKQKTFVSEGVAGTRGEIAVIRFFSRHSVI